MDNDNRNTVVFMVCAMALLVLYQIFVMGPATQRMKAQQAQAAAAAAKLHPVAAASPAPAAPDVRAIASSPRVAIVTPKLGGSIALAGARIDDLYLKDYRTAPDPKAPLIRL
ncbi:MAG: YidC/Oxa1 family insertase periplasmic-domain containing protein, partial [Caulobacteraceae bacterium]|nr:YidC/Oxa1 family insertase periplasmic-domain containing protein [Caulobacteraceae bacterium]